MSFIEHDIADQERFNLLLLEPGEIYFEDFSVAYFPCNLPEKEALKRAQKGHLKICSKSVVFVPKVNQHPILKFPLRNVKTIEEWTGGLFSRIDKDKVLKIVSDQVVEMKANNIISPYVFIKNEAEHRFKLDYASIDDCIPQICQLHRASTLLPAEQSAMINAIVLSRQSRSKFNTSWLEDLYENIVLETQGDRILPLVTNPGRIMLTLKRLYFQPFNNIEKVPVIKIRLKDIKRIIKRRFLLRQLGIEIYCTDAAPCSHIYLAMKSEQERKQLYQSIIQQDELELEDTGQEDMTIKWQNGHISNYDYLLYLNSLADRSFCDLTQYPVMPWVVCDYSSPKLDLTDAATFRDLSKPIGALNEERIEKMRERFKEMPEPRFLYGSHYSTPGYVLFYLARIAPEYVLCLQNGKFDKPDRMFNSLLDTWGNCLEGAADFKELIPEFYCGNGDFLLNKGVSNFGIRQDGRPIVDVDLPPWASSHTDFIEKLREALECDHVSKHLHEWIDLIFGYKQRGDEAIEADNVFYYMTYEGGIDLDSIKDPNERARMEIQIMEFGQTPKQLFRTPHPQRYHTPPTVTTQHLKQSRSPSFRDVWSSNKAEGAQENVLTENGPVSKLTRESSVLTVLSLDDCSTMKIVHQYALHKDSVTNVCLTDDSKNIFSVSRDSLLKMYSLEDQRQLRSINVSSMALSSCQVMPDNKTIIVGSWDNCVYFYSIEFGRILDTLNAHDDAVSTVTWSSDKLMTASWDSTVKIWNFSPPNQDKAFEAADFLGQLDHDSGVNCQCVDEDCRYLVTGTKDGQIVIWDVNSMYQLAEHQVHSGTVNAVALSPDSRKVVTNGEDGFIRVIDVDTGTEIFIKDIQHQLMCLKWMETILLGGGATGELEFWDMDKAVLINKHSAHNGAVMCIDIHSRMLVTGGEDGVICVWKPDT